MERVENVGRAGKEGRGGRETPCGLERCWTHECPQRHMCARLSRTPTRARACAQTHAGTSSTARSRLSRLNPHPILDPRGDADKDLMRAARLAMRRSHWIARRRRGRLEMPGRPGRQNEQTVTDGVNHRKPWQCQDGRIGNSRRVPKLPCETIKLRKLNLADCQRAPAPLRLISAFLCDGVRARRCGSHTRDKPTTSSLRSAKRRRRRAIDRCIPAINSAEQHTPNTECSPRGVGRRASTARPSPASPPSTAPAPTPPAPPAEGGEIGGFAGAAASAWSA